MKLEIAQAIKNAADDIGCDIEIYEAYSGRGMYGKTTTGLTYGREGDLLKAVAVATRNLVEAEQEGDQDLTVEAFIDGLPTKRDSMGLHETIAY